MEKISLKVAGLVTILLLLGGTMGLAYAKGNSPAHLASKGWDFINAGPNLFVHRFPPGSDASSASLVIKAFAT